MEENYNNIINQKFQFVNINVNIKIQFTAFLQKRVLFTFYKYNNQIGSKLCATEHTDNNNRI